MSELGILLAALGITLLVTGAHKDTDEGWRAWLAFLALTVLTFLLCAGDYLR